MNRYEFCDLIYDYKEKAGKTTTSMSYDMRMQWGALRRIEEGKTNFGVDSIIRYLDILGCHMLLMAFPKPYRIVSYADVLIWMKESRKGSYTQRTLAAAIGRSHVNIANIETSKSIMSIDTFLKLTELFSNAIKLEKHEQNS